MKHIIAICFLLLLGCKDESTTDSDSSAGDAGATADSSADTDAGILPPDLGGDTSDCLPDGTCRLDHSCEVDDTEVPYCVDGACSDTPECDVGTCECSQDMDCTEGDYCWNGSCVANSCADDCECGRYATCDEGVCVPCWATCASDPDCPSDLICDEFGYAGSCTQCAYPDDVEVCFPEDGERLVGTRCYRDTDRVCLDNSNCREDELCERDGDEVIGTCMYQIPEPIVCPGGPTCASGDTAPLRAAFAKRPITPLGYEEPRPEYLEYVDDDWLIFNGDTEEPDTFFDCGRDMVCPEDPGYVAPDEDGSEGDGRLQGVWIAGFEHSRPALRCPPEQIGDECVLGPACCEHALAHDDVWAIGAVFEQGESRVALVAIDSAGYFYNDVQRVAARLPEALAIDMVIVASTHDHEAPDLLGQWGPGFSGSDLPVESGRDPVHAAYVEDQIVAVIAEAVDNLTAVDLYAGTTDTGAEGFAIADDRDPWIFDDDLTVLHVVRSGGSRDDPDDTVGVILNWAHHAESMDEGNALITSDYVHWVREYVENGLPAVDTDHVTLDAIPGVGGPVMHTVGALGGIIGPLKATATGRDGTSYTDTSWEKTHALGERVAWAALDGLGDATARTGDLSFSLRELVVGLSNLQFHVAVLSLDLFDRNVVNWRHDDGFNDGNEPRLITSVARVQIGPITFVTVPGEMFPEVFVGGFTAEDVVATPFRGRPERALCNEDLLPPAEDDTEDNTYPCLIDPGNSHPPDLSLAPNTGFLKDVLPGEVFFVIGLGNDELGYIIPEYDFVLHEGAPYVARAPGRHHYEETNSIGPNVMRTVLTEIEQLFELEDPLFVRVE